jgi:hypothetical protein
MVENGIKYLSVKLLYSLATPDVNKKTEKCKLIFGG